MNNNKLKSVGSFTAKPIEQDKSWTRFPRPRERILGCGRSYLYHLDALGLIKTTSIRLPHNKRGIRLLYLPSLLDFIRRSAAEPNEPANRKGGK
jgi:hypothetical protein